MSFSQPDFTIKMNDTLPKLQLSVFDKGCLGQKRYFNLTGVTGVTFSMIDQFGNYKISGKPATIMSLTGGTIQYSWSDDDTTTSGNFKAEFQLQYSDGKRLTIPQGSPISIKIFGEIVI